ncbi:hypothetical protein KAB52_002278 [Salmonella enterica subsp. salamae serovar 4,12:e,n,x:1,6]|nr:hypothetical protein [Salmonella enterica subsp. salamae serovar 4,12:e,n,x:1,6]
MNKRKYISFLIFSITLMTTNANAAVCTPVMETAVKQAQYNAMTIDAAQLEPVAEGFMTNINNSLNTIGCTDIWPTGTIGINLPSFDSIIRKAKEAAISKACSIAREKMNSAMGNISESVSFDVPGLGNIAGGSISTGTGSSAGGNINVNGNSTSGSDVWNSISDAMK